MGRVGNLIVTGIAKIVNILYADTVRTNTLEVSGQMAADVIDCSTLNASTINSKNAVYVGSSAPAASTGILLWMDTSTGLLKYRTTTSGSWVTSKSVWS